MLNRMIVTGILFLVIQTAIAAESNEAVSKTYELDMFSLISFGLAITALLISFFMAWLSWEFYKKSTDASDKTNETVTRVETLVGGIQTNISDIVQRAINHWINSGGGDGQLNQSKLEVYEKIAELEKSLQSVGSGSTEGLLQEFSELKAQIDELGRGIRESQIKSLFPGMVDDTPPFHFTQEITLSEATEQSGFIKITLLRPMKLATATLKFRPHFDAPPELTANLVSSPYEDATSISAKAGTPTAKNCNIHLNSTTTLKAGTYVFEYVAKAC